MWRASVWTALLLAVPVVAQDQVNLCLQPQGGMISALNSAPDHAYTAPKACDDNPATGWVCQRDTYPVWLRVEWRWPVEVRTISFRGYQNCPLPAAGPVGRYRIELLVAGEWSAVASGDASGSTPDDEISHPLEHPVTTQGVRLVVDSAPTGQAAVGELIVSGPDPVLPVQWTRQWQARWIWVEPTLFIPHREPVRVYLRRSFQVNDPHQIAECWLLACAFDRLNNTWVNGHPAVRHISYHGGALRLPQAMRIPPQWLLPGENVLAAEVDDICEVGSRGLLAELLLVKRDGSGTLIPTDGQWQAQTDQGDATRWRRPGLQDPRWVNATVGTGPNARWHWTWNVPRPEVTPLDYMTLVDLQVQPNHARPGEAVTLSLAFECAAPVSRNYAVVVRLGEKSYWRDHDFELWGAYLTPDQTRTSTWGPGRHELKLTVLVPQYAPARTPVTLSVSTPEAAVGLRTRVAGVSADEYGLHFALQVDRGNPPPPTGGDFPAATVRKLGGTPTLHLDGQPTSPIVWTSAYSGYQRYSEYAATGVKLWRILLEGSPICAPGEEDEYYPWWLAQVDKAVRAAVGVDPRVRIIVAVDMDPSPQWLFDEPSEQMLGGRGQLVIPLSLTVPDRGQVRPTFMSAAWRRDGARGLTRLIQHMRAADYAPNIIGVCLFAGRAGENYWGGNERNIFVNEQGQYDCVSRDQWEIGDFSQTARRTFRDFLIHRYGSNEALRRAWRRDDISFDDVLDPARFDRAQITDVLTWADKPVGAGSLRDPLTPGVGRLPMDYLQCFAEAMVDTFDAWGDAVKSASGGRLICGCFYGYALPQLFTSVPGFHGHTAVAHASDCDGLDFFVSPTEYNEYRQPGWPYWGHNITDSLRLHNKLFIYEQDTRTFLAEHAPKTFSRDDTMAVLRRDCARSLTQGAGWWWYEFATGAGGRLAHEWFLDPEILDFAHHIKRIYDYALTLPERGPSSQIAVFYHGETLTAQDIFAPTAQINIPLARTTLLEAMPRLGAPFDLYNLADLPVLAERGLLDQYRLCVFLNPFFLAATERSWLELAKGGGRTLLWLWAPGLARVDSAPAPDNVTEVIEIPGVQTLDRKAPQVYRLTGGDHPILHGLPAGAEVAAQPFPPGTTWARSGNDVWPIVYVAPQAEDQVVVLGHWVLDGRERDDMAALCVRELPHWRSVYAAVPCLTPELLRNLARWAGVHIYREGNEVLYADRHFICISTGAQAAAGELHLPRSTPVYDVFGRRLVSQGTDTIPLQVPPRSTQLFYLGEAAPFRAAVED